MTRSHYPSIKDTTTEILREIQAEQLIKTAEHQVLHQIETPQSDISEGLFKLAMTLRSINADDPEISYTDLHNFMAKCNEQ